MARIVEVESELKAPGSVILTINGGVITFSPDHANQRWVIDSVTVNTDQSATATVVPIAQLALNTVIRSTMSPGNDYGSTWSGNRGTFTGKMNVGPCDFASVLFYCPDGQDASALVGVKAFAVLRGTKYSRRAG